MISKQIFFIWFGDNKPDYLDFSINVFKRSNPDFKVDLINYSIKDVQMCNNYLLKRCRNYIFDTFKEKNTSRYFQYIKFRIQSKFNFIQILSDIYRFELLNLYGGIYLDCDTFPVRPFDNELLNHNSFAIRIISFRNNKYEFKTLHEDKQEFYDLDFINNLSNYYIDDYNDIYFVGLEKGKLDSCIRFNTGIDCNYSIKPQWLRNIENSDFFKQLKENYYKCLELNLDNYNKQYYIVHFPNRSWQMDYKSSPLYCDFDDYIYK